MTTFAAMAARLDSFVSQETTGSADHVYATRNRIFGACADVQNAAVEITLYGKTPYLCKITDGHFVPEASVATHADSLNAQLLYDDGAGGAAVALSDATDGTAAGVTGYARTDFPVLATTVSIPVGSRIYAAVSVNGAGDVWDDTHFECEIAYD